MPQFNIPAEFLHICEEEVVRSSLTSLPLKAAFAEQRSMTLNQVHDWMRSTRNAFESAVKAAQPE